MGKLLRAAQPCPCGVSSDAYHYYTDGEYCFSCSKAVKYDENNRKENMSETDEVTLGYHPHRGLTYETMRQFGAMTKFIGGVPVEVIFPFVQPRDDELPSVGKVRAIPEKEFRVHGDNPEGLLFGEEVFPPGCSDTITITEGEYDAMSSWQITGRPAVSVKGASSARKDIAKRFEYINSFPKIVLAFDTDTPGQKAKKAVAGLFDFNKVHELSMSPLYKDANGYLQAGKSDEYKRLWWNSKKFMPEGVMSTFTEFDQALESREFQDPLCTFPFPSLQEMFKGLRPGEVTLLTAPEGIGKTEIIRAFEYHFLKETDYNIGTIHLEENKSRTLKGLAGLVLQEPVHLPDSQVPLETVKQALRNLVRRDDRLCVYNNFGGDDPDFVLDTMRFLGGACGCRLLTLDHITMLGTGKAEKDERLYLDYISNKMATMARELNFHLLMISHQNDDGQTRGSRNISKVADNRIDLFRDIIAEDEDIRNTTTLTVSKNRLASLTGPAGALKFDPETFVLTPTNALHDAEELPA